MEMHVETEQLEVLQEQMKGRVNTGEWSTQ